VVHVRIVLGLFGSNWSRTIELHHHDEHFLVLMGSWGRVLHESQSNTHPEQHPTIGHGTRDGHSFLVDEWSSPSRSIVGGSNRQKNRLGAHRFLHMWSSNADECGLLLDIQEASTADGLILNMQEDGVRI